MYYTLNRIEEDSIAVFTDDNGKIYTKTVSFTDMEIHVGDVFILSEDRLIFCEEETKLRRERARKKKNALFNKFKNTQEG